MTLPDQYKKVVNNYIRIFCKKQSIDTGEWVDEIGSIILLGDYYLNFRDIKHDIDENIEPDLIFKWYNECIEDHICNQTAIDRINYKNYTKGMRFTDL